MGLADIQKKQSEERKREKRLVHFTNSITRDFIDSKYVKSKAKTTREAIEYITKSFLDYLFFEEHKEIRELHDQQVKSFFREFAPRKLTMNRTQAKTAATTLANVFKFLEDQGHIHNGYDIGEIAKKNATSFSKKFPTTVKKSRRNTTKAGTKKRTRKKTARKKYEDMDIGRNDPCPCGSGKKYKKCHGKQTRHYPFIILQQFFPG